MANVTIDHLLNLVPERPQEVLSYLQQNSQLAAAQDSYGYSLLHASVSYNHPALLRSLVRDFHADINLRDEDGETPLFASESVDIARVVLEELGGDSQARNNEGQTAAEKMLEENEHPVIAAYLREFASGAATSVAAQTAGANGAPQAQAGTVDMNGTSSNGVHPPPPLPQGVNINMGTMTEGDADEAGEPDPEIRRRIEELASRPDFESEETQAELRRLVTDALGGYSAQAAQDGPEAKRRAQ